MSYQVYKVLHVLGILTVFTALGAAAMLALRGASDEGDKAVRKVLMILHGVGLVVIVVAGFGLMARTGIVHGTSWPPWLYGKIAVWLALGAAVGFIRRAGGKALWWVVALPLLGAVAAFMAVYKPGAAGPS